MLTPLHSCDYLQKILIRVKPLVTDGDNSQNEM